MVKNIKVLTARKMLRILLFFGAFYLYLLLITS